MSEAEGSFEDAMKTLLQCIPVSPWSLEVECLDILTKAEDEGFLEKLYSLLTRLFSSSSHLEPKQGTMLRQGSMLHEKLVRDISAWREDRPTLRRGLDQLMDPKVTKPRTPYFTKKQKPGVRLNCKKSKGFSAWVSGGFEGMSTVKGEESLIFTLDGLTEASVAYEKVIDWTDGGEGAWLPNIERGGLGWSKKPGSINSIWVVTTVLYATKLTVTGRHEVFAGVSAKIPNSSTVNAGLLVHKEDDNQLVVKAPNKKQFIVGYRVIRLDYNHDGTPSKTVDLKHAGFRGKNDDIARKHLEAMEKDFFFVDEDGLVASIQLLTPSEAAMDELELELKHTYLK